MLVEYKGRLVPIEEPIDLAERGTTLHPCTVIDLTDEDYQIILDSDGFVRDSMAEEEEQARNEEDETIEAEVSQATTYPAPEYLPLYQDPPGIDDPFVSE